MSKIFDNAEQKVDDGINAILTNSGVTRADFCVGYFNLRGWKLVCDNIEKLNGETICEAATGHFGQTKSVHRTCRLLIGMHSMPHQYVQDMFSTKEQKPDGEMVKKCKRALLNDLRKQLTYGYQTSADEHTLQCLQKQLQTRKVVVKVHLHFPLHAKLYLAHRKDNSNPVMSIMGSSNLTFNGLYRNGELNAEFGDFDDGQKFAKWFNKRWDDVFSLDITDDLALILDESWASTKHPTPYEIYLKIMYHLGQEALCGVSEYQLPPPFHTELYDFQKTAVQLILRHLKKRGGAMLGDVVGLGKTITACAVAKYYEERQGASSLIICPPNLIDMWKSYRDKYDLKVSVRSMAHTFDPKKERFYKLVIIDESHNLRNSNGKRYSLIHDLLTYQGNDVLLLTATPFNKDYTDIAAQLKLFLDPDVDLGLRPERAIKEIGGEQLFVQAYPEISMSSIRAFEKSDSSDDWRDLLKLYLVRRTRTFIKNNYAKIDEKQPERRYLELKDGSRNYFPDRVPKTICFETQPDDSFERLYSDKMMDLMGDMTLPRYGLDRYVSKAKKATAPKGDKDILNNLTTAGKRLMGFCRSGFCKRMDSSGIVFLTSLYRHAVRNAMYLYAIKNKLKLPLCVGVELSEGWLEEDNGNGELIYSFPTDPAIYAEKGECAYKYLAANCPANVKWISSEYFTPSLKTKLEADNELIFQMLTHCGAWHPSQDNKLIALKELLTKTHAQDKVLIFTQYTDTAHYIAKQLKDAGITAIDQVDGDTENMTERVFNFSPHSNHRQPPPQETRILIATDTLSEGQNLQDAHIVVNYDLPWAIIRLIQRAGRVDRIGQKSTKVYCYSFFPQEGVDKIINLTNRLNKRINKNAEAVGSDEIFFEGNKQNLKDIFNEKAGILEDTDDGEVDLASHAYQAWQSAINGKPKLEARIKSLANVVYSTKSSGGKSPGVITYARTANGNDVLSWYGTDGKLVTQSFSSILNALTCTPETPSLPSLPNHHDLVKLAIEEIADSLSSHSTMGVMGSKSSARWRLFNLLQMKLKEDAGTLFADVYQQMADEVYQYPLREQARTAIHRQFMKGASAHNILQLAQQYYDNDELCAKPSEDVALQQNNPAHVICSLGLVKE